MSTNNSPDNLFGVSYGLDFGTYRSVLAYKETDEAPKIPSYRSVSQGGVPSLFWRTASGAEYVGDQVAEANGVIEDPIGVCASVKMQLNKPSISLNGHNYRPSNIAIQLVKRILSVSREALAQDFIDMEFDELVVGVPVRFNAAEKGEIFRIMEIATGGKRIRLVPEPILAAIANDYFQRRLGRVSRPMLVYDMGAGTFDAVLLMPNRKRTTENPHPYIALHPEGLHLAGDVLDEVMEDLLLEKVQKNPGLRSDVLKNKGHHDRRRLKLSARELKERLSSAESSSSMISGIDCGSGMVTVSREEFESRIRPLIAKTVTLSASVLERADLGPEPDIDILLVGGSTYIPLIRRMLSERFSWLAPGNIMQRFPEKAVALGAAIYAGEPELVIPKVAYGYAVTTIHEDVERLHVRIPANADLPKTEKAFYYTRFDNQSAVRFDVYEISSEEQNAMLDKSQGKRIQEYTLQHKFGKAVPKGTAVELTTSLTEDGLLTMEVDDLGVSGEKTRKTFSLTNNIAL